MQITRTTPDRLMILHFSQIFLTLARTFMVVLRSPHPRALVERLYQCGGSTAQKGTNAPARREIIRASESDSRTMGKIGRKDPRFSDPLSRLPWAIRYLPLHFRSIFCDFM